MVKPRHIILIGRPINELLTFITVVCAGLLLNDIPPIGSLVVAAAGAAFICGFGNALNDYADRKIDRINRPDRPIPSGLLTPRQGLIAAILHLAAGVALAWAAGYTCLLIAAAAAILLVGYSLFGKRLLVFSNMWVAAVSALSFAYAAAVADTWTWTQIRFVALGIVLGFLFHLGREIVKDMADQPGDSELGVRTVPIAFGLKASKAAAIAVFALMIAAMFLAWILYELTVIYLVSSTVLLVIPLAAVLRRFAGSSDRTVLRATEHSLKMLMPLGLAVLLIARYSV